MFATLLESRPLPRRTPLRRLGGVASVVAHAALLAGAVVATGRAAPHAPEPRAHPLVFVAPRPVAPPAAPLPSPHRFSTQSATNTFHAGPSTPSPSGAPRVPVLALPGVDLSLPPGPARPVDDGFAHSLGRAGGGAVGVGDVGRVWEGNVVDVPAEPARGNPAPSYPDALRAAGVEGRVVARFVVDTLGRVEPGSVEIPATDADARFVDAVRAVLPRMRFRPATVGARRVRQQVEQPFAFTLVR